MKKNWKAKNEEGITLLIVTILTVAITVSMASVLYGLSDRGGGERFYQPPVGSLNIDIISSNSVKITFGQFSPNPSPMEIRVIITNNSNTEERVELSFANPPDAGTINMVATGGASATYTDLNYLGNSINAGDYITVDALNPHTNYSVMVYHNPSDGLCMLAGTTTFTLE